MSIKVIVLDFDNCVLLDEKTRQGSEEVKDRAWFEVFSEYRPERLEPVLEQAKTEVSGGRGDRDDIAEKILKHFNWPEKKLKTEIKRRCDTFNQMVQKGILQIGVSEKTKTTLTDLSARLPLYVNTATPVEAARESLDALDIEKIFTGVYGRPGTKTDNLSKIIDEEKIDPKHLLFVDDQQSGWQAAQEVSCQFIGIHTARNTSWHKKKQPFPIINSLDEIKKLIK